MDTKERLRLAEEFAEINLKQCCIELVDWNDTAILINGKVRELAAMCSGLGNGLTLATAIIQMLALKKVAAP